MAHKKGMGSSRNGRDSNAQRLGIKRFGGELVTAGSIIVRQRGTKYHPGANVGIGSDDTLFAKIEGHVKFEPCARARATGSIRYGHHSAPATAEVVRSTGSRVHTRTRTPRSARTTAVVSPTTPPPTTMTSLFRVLPTRGR